MFIFILVFNWLWYWQIHVFEYDCGLAFGSTAFLLKKYNIQLINRMWSNGSRKRIRFPVHTAFIFMFIFFPYMRLDMLILAVVLNIYNVIGSILYDKRLIQFGGEDYLNYIKNTNLILPKVKVSNYVNPYLYSDHFKNKTIYLTNLIIGLIIGLLMFFVIKNDDYNFYTSLSVLLFSTVFGVLSGLITSIHYLRNKSCNFLEPKFHTILATKVGVTAAITTITWAALHWLYFGKTPIVSLFFIVWFNMLWVGHICCGRILEYRINFGEHKQ